MSIQQYFFDDLKLTVWGLEKALQYNNSCSDLHSPHLLICFLPLSSRSHIIKHLQISTYFVVRLLANYKSPEGLSSHTIDTQEAKQILGLITFCKKKT